MHSLEFDGANSAIDRCFHLKPLERLAIRVRPQLLVPSGVTGAADRKAHYTMTVKCSMRKGGSEMKGVVTVPAFGDFLFCEEDPDDYQNFRRLQVLALEPRSISELQIALTIADIGWDIHRHTTALDRLEREKTLLGFPADPRMAVTSFSLQMRTVPLPNVLSRDGRDRSTVPFSPKTDPRLGPKNASEAYHEARIAELEAHIETLSNSLRISRLQTKDKPFVMSNAKLQ